MTLVPVHDTASSLELAPQAFELAQKIARTDFVPTALRGKPEAIMAAILTGNEVGIGPMQALSKIHVIEGRPTMAAELVRALVIRAGHEVWIEETTNTRCVILGQRNGSTRETRITWTMDDAKRAGLDGRQNWRKYPRAMLLARATTELCRAVFPEVLAGISYTTEEVADGDFVDVEDLTAPESVSPGSTESAPSKAKRTRKATKAITPTAAPAATETVTPEVVDAPALPGEDDYEGPDQDLKPDGPLLPWENATAIRAEKAGLDDVSRHGLWLVLSRGRTERAVGLDAIERGRALDVLERIESNESLLATAGDEGDAAWALIERGAGIVAHYGAVTGVELTIVAPEAQRGEVVSYASVEAPGSDEDQGPVASEGSGGTVSPGDGSPAPTPSHAPETGTPVEVPDEAGWRRLMREQRLKVSDIVRLAGEVTPEGQATPGSIPSLVEAPAIAEAVYRRITGAGS